MIPNTEDAIISIVKAMVEALAKATVEALEKGVPVETVAEILYELWRPRYPQATPNQLDAGRSGRVLDAADDRFAVSSPASDAPAINPRKS